MESKFTKYNKTNTYLCTSCPISPCRLINRKFSPDLSLGSYLNALSNLVIFNIGSTNEPEVGSASRITDLDSELSIIAAIVAPKLPYLPSPKLPPPGLGYDPSLKANETM